MEHAELQMEKPIYPLILILADLLYVQQEIKSPQVLVFQIPILMLIGIVMEKI